MAVYRFADRYRQKVEFRFVNASRFEGLTKELYVQVAVSKHTFDAGGLIAGEGMALQMMEVPVVQSNNRSLHQQARN